MTAHSAISTTHGQPAGAAPFLELQLVDEANIFRATTAASVLAPSSEQRRAELPEGFDIRSVRKLSGGALIDATRATGRLR